MKAIGRRQALLILGGACTSAALFDPSAGFIPAANATTAMLTLVLDKSVYKQGEPMEMVLTEHVQSPDRRRIAISDSTGTTWTKVSDDGVTVVYTAVAGSSRLGDNTVAATLVRKSDGATFHAAAVYQLSAPWMPRFTGDREGRAMLGMAVTDKGDSNLQWEDAMRLLGGAASSVSVRRCFRSDWISKSGLEWWADWAELHGVYPVLSFKVPGDNWAAVTAGTYDRDLDLLCTTLADRSKAGRAPVCVAVHHEPSGDGDLAVWAKMQEYLSNRFAPWNTVFCFTTISNGNDWGPYRGGRGDVAKMYPSRLIDTLNRNNHVLACDTYDSSDASNLDYSRYDRTSLKIEGFVQWARSQGVQRIGLGEFGCHDDIDINRCWALVRDNRDLFAYANYFNSGQNSRADWRMTPADYPPDPAVSTYVDAGGSRASAARLAAGVNMFAASVNVG